MWKSQITTLQENQHQYHLLRDGDRLTFGDFIRALREDADFRQFYNTLLADSPLEGIYWEHPPLSESILEQPYEMVLIEAPYFSGVTPAPASFRAHFSDGELVADFRNIVRRKLNSSQLIRLLLAVSCVARQSQSCGYAPSSRLGYRQNNLA